MITLRSSVRTTASRRGVSSAEDRCDDDDDEADVVERRRGRAGRYRRNRALPAGVEKARSEWRGLGGDRSQEIHRLFGGEYSGMGCYIVVTAGREDSRGLGNPMTEPFPRRPRVLGSPRSVALAKEGVPPELGTRVRSPSTTKARGPGETTRRHGPRHVRARDNGVIPPNTAHGSGVFDPIPAAARHRLLGVSGIGRFAPAPRRIPPPTLKPTGPSTPIARGRNLVGIPCSTPRSGLDHRGVRRFAEVSQVVRG